MPISRRRPRTAISVAIGLPRPDRGVDIKTVSMLLGHSSEAFTLQTYVHLMHPVDDPKVLQMQTELLLHVFAPMALGGGSTLPPADPTREPLPTI